MLGVHVDWRRGQHGRVAFGQAVVAHEELAAVESAGGVELVEDAARHRGVVDAAPRAGDDEQARLDGTEDVAQLALPVDGQTGVLDGAESGQRAHQHDRLETGGELPRHRDVGADAERRQPGRHPLGTVLELSEGEGLLVLVHGEQRVGAGCGLVLHECPEARRRRSVVHLRNLSTVAAARSGGRCMGVHGE